MNSSPGELWMRFQKYYREYPSIGMSLDLSRMDFPDDFLASIEAAMKKAFDEMAQLEKGAIANQDEKRMVGHYWLRNPALAPNVGIRKEIEDAVASIKAFAAEIHQGAIKGAKGPFKNLLLIGIGGSALGPQFVANALGNPLNDKLKPYFFDNTDPDGMDKVLGTIGQTNLGQTLCVVVSKSGGTKETRNGMLEARHAYEQAGLDFEKHAVAVTSAGSDLDKYASGWLAQFPMWDWVGGRTSELSAVGLLPAALQGIDVQGMLDGAKACDEITRIWVLKDNPAALLAAMWFYIGNGKGTKNMVVLPYKDRLELFSKYLQQLVMESLGKALDRAGKLVNQGITVLGNKGSTDQHSYVQQLRDGLSNFFVIFIQVLRDRQGQSFDMEPQVTSGDYLTGFLLGTRRALHENGRQSITITIREVVPQAVGALIALFERTVGLYGSLVNVNAYHQPGVEAGKKAAADVIELQTAALKFLAAGKAATAQEIAECTGHGQEVETVFKIMEHLAANPDRGIVRTAGQTAYDSKYRIG